MCLSFVSELTIDAVEMCAYCPGRFETTWDQFICSSFWNSCIDFHCYRCFRTLIPRLVLILHISKGHACTKSNHFVSKLTSLYAAFKWSALIIQKPNKGSWLHRSDVDVGRCVADISIDLKHIPQRLGKGGEIITSSFFGEIPCVFFVALYVPRPSHFHCIISI
jgi:hypothetical protein